MWSREVTLKEEEDTKEHKEEDLRVMRQRSGSMRISTSHGISAPGGGHSGSE